MGTAPTPSPGPSLATVGALALLCVPAAAPADTRPPVFTCEQRIADGVVETVSPDGELRLSGGANAVRIADVRVSGDSDAGRRALSWLSSLAGSVVRVREVGPPDRWDRASAHVELPGPAPIDVGDLLVGEGLAVVDPGQRDLLCRPDLLQVENGARQRRIGQWRDSRWPIAAGSMEELERAAGRFAIVEGRVVSVGERRERTYLNFGRDWSRDFNVTIPRRSWADLKARGITADSLKGRVVRVRGLLEKRRSPTLDLTVPDVLEIVDGQPRRTARE